MRFQILGLVGVLADGMALEVRGSKMRTFLASLLLARGRVVSDGRLMDMLWGEDLPTTTQAQIQTYASRLRILLGEQVRIERQPPGYRLKTADSSDIHVDLIAFENLATEGYAALVAGRYKEASRLLRTGLAQWSGHALGGVTDHLASVARPQLEEARLLAQERCIAAELALGKDESLITELTALVASEPLRERPRMQLMSALHSSGRTADALAAYRSFRAHIAESLGLDPSPDLQQLHQSILTSTPVPRPRPPAVFAVRRDPPGPTLLPAEPTDFVGRSAEEARARAVLASSSASDAVPPVCVISGMGGTGKTTLARRLARQLSGQFPDRQVLIDLTGHVPGESAHRHVLHRALSTLGLPADKVPADPADKIGMYRALLSGSRSLLVLDGAVNERQVRPLLPGLPGTAVLITSRAPLGALEGAERLRLDAFSLDESLDLLGRIVGHDRVAAERRAAIRIVELCGRLPIAVRVCGARLEARPHWTLDRLASRLADPRNRLAELHAGDLDVLECLLPAYEELAQHLSRALSELAVLGADTFTCATASALLGLSTSHTLDLLDDLVAAGMLRPELAPECYRLPQLVLALVASRAPLRYAG